MSAAQGLLNSVFSCSSPAGKVRTKQKLRQTRSLDPAIIRQCGTGTEAASGAPILAPIVTLTEAGASSSQILRGKEAIGTSLSSPSIPLDVSPTSNFLFDYEVKRSKHRIATSASTGALFSPRRWFLQKRNQTPSSHADVAWKSEGDFTWSSLSGQSVRLTPVAIQNLSELERARLQEVAFARLHQDYDVGCQITVPKDGQKRKKSLRRKLDSLAKEKSKDRGEQPSCKNEVSVYSLYLDQVEGLQAVHSVVGARTYKVLTKQIGVGDNIKQAFPIKILSQGAFEGVPQAFSIPLSQVIANDRTHRQRQDTCRHDLPQREEHKDSSDLVSSILQFATKRSSNKELSSSNSSLSSTSETANESTSPNTPEAAPRVRRRGGMSVDSITDLDDNQSRLLEALQLSLPPETPSKKEKHRDKRLSLNPIYRQVPRVVDSCCHHIEKYGLQTVGIFRVGSSKKRVRQLREEFDRGVDVHLDEEHSVHDVAALLKEFLRDMPDPLLTKELYTAFINTTLLDREEQHSVTQLLVYLLPASNSDTLQRLLEFLSTVADHAHNRKDKDGQEITGNKMTSLNLATIFGPNLLHKLKSSDKEFSVQSSARAEESTAVIAALQKMIASYQTLFMVPPDLQNEVLMSLLETDPDVVDYLLRRKASQSTDLLQSEEPFTLNECHSSSDSNKVSSGEVSPYDNNSPVLSERRGEAGKSGVPTVAGRAGESPTDGRLGADCISEEHANIWGTWHATLKPAFKDKTFTGSHGNVSEGSSRSSLEGLDCFPGDSRHQTLTSPTRTPRSGMAECSSSMGSHPRQPPVNHPAPALDAAQGRANANRSSRSPPPYNARHLLAGRQSSPRQTTQPSGEHLDSEGPLNRHSPEWQNWQRDRWQIWQLLSSDSADALPETLV